MPVKNKKRLITAEDIYNFTLPTSVAMSPDEKQLAYTLTRMDKEENKYYNNLYVMDVASGKSRQFTFGKTSDREVAWSKDGSRLAFVSTRDKKTGIYVIPADGGAEKKIIELDGAISDLQWTPDMKELVFAFRYNDSHYIKDEKEKKKTPVYRHVTRLYYRMDSSGFVPKDRFNIYRLGIDSAKLVKITKGARDNMQPHLSSDGKLIVYISNRSKNEDIDSDKLDIFMIPFKGGKERRIPTPAGPSMFPRFSPDGKTIVYLGHDNPEDAWGVTNTHIWLVGTHGRPKARDLMPGYDRSVFDASIGDLEEDFGSEPLQWSRDGKRMYFLSSDTGVTNIFYITRSGGKPTRVFKGNCHVKGFSINGSTQKMGLVYSDLKTPNEIYIAPANYGAERKAKKLTGYNQFIDKEIKLADSREVWFKSFDGTEIQGWLVKPPDFKAGRKYPTILNIHGGPRAQYAFTFFHEMQYLAAKGYVVFYTNPRGGLGRGTTWADAITGEWGELDYRDCMAATDFLEKQKFVNPKKLGVTGGSYGGFMTNWIIGHTDRFKAAVTQRSVVNLVSFAGSSDIGFSLRREFGWPWENEERYKKYSPITYFKNVKTPVLIIHSESDLRCGIEQAEQMFLMLKALGKKVEFLRFPEEPHGLSRHGRPDRRVARLEWIAKWFDRYLK